MNEREALQKIHEIIQADALGIMPTKHNDCYFDLLQQIIPVLEQALEQSEPRLYSEEEIGSIVESLRCALVVMKRDCDFLYAIDKTEEALCKWDKLQSLSPKEVKPNLCVKCGKDCFLSDNEAGTEREIKRLCKQCSQSQELQPKESIEAMAEKEVWMPTYWSSPDQVVNKYGNSVQGVERAKGYFLTKEELEKVKSLGRISVINEVEEYIIERSKLGWDGISNSVLMAKLNNLKK